MCWALSEWGRVCECYSIHHWINPDPISLLTFLNWIFRFLPPSTDFISGVRFIEEIFVKPSNMIYRADVEGSKYRSELYFLKIEGNSLHSFYNVKKTVHTNTSHSVLWNWYNNTQRSIDRDRSAARDTAASQDHPLTWSVMSMVMMLPMFPSSLSWGSVTPVSSWNVCFVTAGLLSTASLPSV